MAQVSVIGPDDGESIQLGMGEITLAPHTAGVTNPHYARHDEGFYVVSGAARFTVGETVHDAPRPSP